SYWPTAQMSVDETAETPNRVFTSPGIGVDEMNQPVPSQCSASGFTVFEIPTAHASSDARARTSNSSVSPEPIKILVFTVQARPSQCSTSPSFCSPLASSYPTDHTSLVVTPSTSSR